MNSAYATVPLVPANFSFISNNNLDSKNQKEFADTNVKIFKGNINRTYPPGYVAIPLVSSNYSVISDKNLNSYNPPEFAANSQIFQETKYVKLSYDENPNAFRNAQSFQAPIIPSNHKNSYARTSENIEMAKDKKIEKDLKNLNQFNSEYIPPNKYAKFRLSSM